ncbi:C2H2 transcription factor [Histoplasma capsulatum G186AR]|uniref:C2H2 transcription factor n=1 Tax=Ajellomyces capsulatus TaxID=5037 RepID=A0A8H7YGN1_AJECA|nr:C2H2 transcription factor [Histoplasma capsulatum]QSS68430.1 C2H2 transcription factor [Histoplasma capsulatum G186AR]
MEIGISNFSTFPVAGPDMHGYQSHRRGTSLDTGVLGQCHFASIPPRLVMSSSLPQFLDIAHPHNGVPAAQRPSTPKEQTGSESLPLTPATTPFRRSKDFFLNSKSAQLSPIRRRARRIVNKDGSSSMQRTRSLQGVVGSNFTLPKAYDPSQTNSASFNAFDSFTPLPDIGDDVFSDFTFHHYDDPKSSAVSFDLSSFPAQSPINSQPEPTDETQCAEAGNSLAQPSIPITPAIPLIPAYHQTADPSPYSSPQKAPLSPRNISIAGLNLDDNINASIEETGITLDDIAAFIEGPDPVDKKWVCTYGGCNKRFGRKENIKSHVQTHLGDRQFKCNHCNKCFVRGHDLKRHAKIHTGIKPYPCECGNSFARQDALTRHKQRGMCSGAFKGAVRKVVKRGRPRKHRPEQEERQEKAIKSRIGANIKSYASSVSESSCLSLASPPSESNDSGSVRESSVGDDMQYLHSDGFGLPPGVFSFTPPASPGFSTGNVASPTRSLRSMTPTMDRNFLSLSPTKRPLDDIPEEIPDIPLLLGSPTPVKKESQISSSQFLLPSPAEPTFAAAHGSDFDVFTGSQHTAPASLSTILDESELVSLEIPSAVGCLPAEPGDPIQSGYGSELFLAATPAQRDNVADLGLSSQFFSGSFSQYSDDFFSSFSSEVGNDV